MQENIGTCYSVTKSFLTVCNHRDCSMQSLTMSWSLPKFVSIALVMPSNHLILYDPLLLLPSIFPSVRVFFSGSSHQVAKVLELIPKQIYRFFTSCMFIYLNSKYYQFKPRIGLKKVLDMLRNHILC